MTTSASVNNFNNDPYLKQQPVLSTIRNNMVDYVKENGIATTVGIQKSVTTWYKTSVSDTAHQKYPKHRVMKAAKQVNQLVEKKAKFQWKFENITEKRIAVDALLKSFDLDGFNYTDNVNPLIMKITNEAAIRCFGGDNNPDSKTQKPTHKTPLNFRQKQERLKSYFHSNLNKNESSKIIIENDSDDDVYAPLPVSYKYNNKLSSSSSDDDDVYEPHPFPYKQHNSNKKPSPSLVDPSKEYDKPKHRSFKPNNNNQRKSEPISNKNKEITSKSPIINNNSSHMNNNNNNNNNYSSLNPIEPTISENEERTSHTHIIGDPSSHRNTTIVHTKNLQQIMETDDENDEKIEPVIIPKKSVIIPKGHLQND